MPSKLWNELSYSNFNGCTVQKLYNRCDHLSIIELN